MEIRLMTAQDIPAVAALEQQCFSQPWSEHSLSAELANPHALFYTAYENDTLAGYIGMHRVLDEGYVANVAVNPTHRRGGVGDALVEQLLTLCQKERLGFLTLEVREGNLPAIRLYEKHGFGEVGRRKNFYANPTEDALLMTVFL